MPGMTDETTSATSSPFTPPSAPAGTPTKDDRNMALLMYLLALVTHWLGPLIIWLIKKDSSPFINDQGKELLNFQITVYIALLVASLTCFIGIGIVLVPLVGICNLVFIIIGAVAVSKGTPYRFPFALRLLK